MALVLVTGGAGFIGSHVVCSLLEKGDSVRVLDDLSTGKQENLPSAHPDLTFVQGSIEDAELVAQVCQGVDAVVHLAALVSVPMSVEHPAKSAAINVDGFLNLLNCLRDNHFQGRFLFASSSAVYGSDTGEQALSEQDAPGRLLSPYAVDKYTNELYANLYADLYGMRTLGFRFFNIYGPRQDPSSVYSGVISIFMNRASQGEDINIYGDGGQVRDFVYVGDLADILCRALENDVTGVLNIGTGQGISINALAEQVKQLYEVDLSIDHLAPRAGDIRYSCANIDGLRQAIGAVPTVKLEQGLSLLKQWMEE